MILRNCDFLASEKRNLRPFLPLRPFTRGKSVSGTICDNASYMALQFALSHHPKLKLKFGRFYSVKKKMSTKSVSAESVETVDLDDEREESSATNSANGKEQPKDSDTAGSDADLTPKSRRPRSIVHQYFDEVTVGTTQWHQCNIVGCSQRYRVNTSI